MFPFTSTTRRPAGDVPSAHGYPCAQKLCSIRRVYFPVSGSRRSSNTEPEPWLPPPEVVPNTLPAVSMMRSDDGDVPSAQPAFAQKEVSVSALALLILVNAVAVSTAAKTVNARHGES